MHKGQFESLQQNALRWNNRLRQALAVCNGLSWINKTLVGVDMERSMFKAVEARFLVGTFFLFFFLLWGGSHTFTSHSLFGVISACFVLNMEHFMFKAVETRFLIDALRGFSCIC